MFCLTRTDVKLKQNDSVGSGVIIDKKGDLYTLITNRHVVCGNQRCFKLPATESYNLGLSDGQQYQIKTSSIKLLGNDLDLAIIRFRSSRNYSVVKISAPGSLRVDDNGYTAGFPFEQPGFTFGAGNAIAVVNKRLKGDSGGYTVIYNAQTLPGMSGGGVFDSNGQLVAIHGYGDRYRDNTDVGDKSRVDSKMGVNRGIPVRWLVQNLAELGINLGTARNIADSRVIRYQLPATADEYFIAGFNKYVEPGNNVVNGKKQAIQALSTAIQLNLKYQHAFSMRAYVYEQMQEFQKSLADYNQAILLNPKDSNAFNNRANLKKNKLNDIQGALADYNQAILLNPKFSDPYNNRANLKADKLNDIQGALADYNQSILLDPKDFDAYNNRANLKQNKLNDIPGALADYNQSILLNPQKYGAYYNRAILKAHNLNDSQGALADYDQAILLNPKIYDAYNNRANLKAEKLNDSQGALADYSQAIFLNPKYSQSYYNRAVLKYDKLNDRAGAIQDFRQAARLFRAQGDTQNLQQTITALESLGATE
jgi:tetratricopeptide (TPR) repeat protein